MLKECFEKMEKVNIRKLKEEFVKKMKELESMELELIYVKYVGAKYSALARKLGELVVKNLRTDEYYKAIKYELVVVDSYSPTGLLSGMTVYKILENVKTEKYDDVYDPRHDLTAV